MTGRKNFPLLHEKLRPAQPEAERQQSKNVIGDNNVQEANRRLELGREASWTLHTNPALIAGIVVMFATSYQVRAHGASGTAFELGSRRLDAF